MLRGLSVLAATFFALVVNPGVACGPAEEEEVEWQYTEDEMELAVVGTYEGTATVDGAEVPVTLLVERPIAPAATQQGLRLQCGSRSLFVKPAGACFSATTMTLAAELTSTSAELASIFSGNFMAGLDLEGGEIELLREGDPDKGHITARFEQGSVGEWTLYNPPDTIELTLTRR